MSTDQPSGGGGMGRTVGIVVVLAVVLGLAFVFFGGGDSEPQDLEIPDVSVDDMEIPEIEIPDDVDSEGEVTEPTATDESDPSP